jgi:hypothetical protein
MPNKQSAKKQSKSKPKARKLPFGNITNRKKVALVILLAIVVVGVAMIIRSFAGTDTTYSVNAGTLKLGNATIIVSGKPAQVIMTETAGSKSGVKVIKMTDGRGFAVTSSPVTIPVGQSYQMCITSAGSNTGQWSVHLPKSSSSDYAVVYINTPSTVGTTYQQYCSGTYKANVDMKTTARVQIYDACPNRIFSQLECDTGNFGKLSALTVKFIGTISVYDSPSK